MADQDEVTQGAIPPKVLPFTKPEGVSPITPAAAPGAPRPITVRLRPVAPAADAAKPAEAAEAPAAPAVGIPAAAPANPRATARVPVPESVAAVTPSAIRPATVRLRPVMAPSAAPAHMPGATQPITKIEPVAAAPAPLNAPLQPQHPPTPGSNPLPEGPKPPSGAQVQAAKSKTSRISLDSAIGVAPVGAEKEGPKTIRLKRPMDLAATPVSPTVQKPSTAAARQTSRIPDSALPTAEALAADNASVTQKKTLKIKRPSAAKEEGAAAEGEAFPEGVQMTPLSPIDFPAKEESSVLTTISVIAAIAATVLVAALLWILAAQAVGPVKGKNAIAFIEGPELPCPGRIVN
ncbi:MAG TPA: hypothetical protein PKM57_02040 [Kiritimatiellia bacterium]|nr:hypothetical protein [Kiritimatiellia bacterium]HPS08333.1 hypothetical protein [Kiritimatiellia bacterium]